VNDFLIESGDATFSIDICDISDPGSVPQAPAESAAATSDADKSR
jgi:hypothetical protein